jgi:sphinganine-1-phosphate aldolase
MSLSPSGLSSKEIAARLAAFRQHDVPWREGRLFAGLYDPGTAVEESIKEAYMAFLTENALYPNYFPSLLQLENEVIATLRDLLRGDETVVGNCTSGGTESILLAVKTARDHARATRPAIIAPELVLPRTAHAAFHKACHYLGVKPVIVEVNATTFRVEPAAMAAAITPNTIMLVASAPCYSHGTIDPVGAIAALAAEYGLLCHVDACVGGVHLSIMRRAGYAVPDFDWSVPGVTSISVDMHKYGYAAKNASALLYRNRELRRYALFSCASTTGYAVINTTVLSSRSGGPIAGAWAALHALGENGYREIVEAVMGATGRLIAGVEAFGRDLYLLGQPDMCLLTLASDTINVFALDDEMTARGWALQPQFSAGGSPPNLHLSINRSNVDHIDALLADLQGSVATLKDRTAAFDPAALRARVEQLMSDPGPDTFAQIAALAGMAPGSMPTSFARINTVLDLLPDPVVDMLLVEYLNSIYS